MNNIFRERLTRNAEDFDGIVVDILAEIDKIKQKHKRLRVVLENLANPAECEDVHDMATAAELALDQDTCDHEWGTDGQHSNEYCKKCFIDKYEEEE